MDFYGWRPYVSVAERLSQPAGRDRRSDGFWLPERNTDSNTVLENPGWPQFSTLLTEAGNVGGEDCCGGFDCQ